jgi:type II secretory pathway pseudopilin PulG
MIIAVAVLGLTAVILVPALQSTLHRSKLEGFARNATMLIQEARFEAIRNSATCVVQLDVANRQLFAFADIDGATAGSEPDGVFNPVTGEEFRTTDFALRPLRLPSGVSFTSPTHTGLNSVDGFVNAGNPDPPDKQAMLELDGSILAEGAFRFADQRGNYLEARVAPAATARVELRKWNEADSAWYASGEEGKPWEWR